jgi:hypothetical protein
MDDSHAHDHDTTPVANDHYYAASLTACEYSRLAYAPDAAEYQRIEQACSEVRQQRKIAVEFHKDPRAAKLFSLELFRTEAFQPLYVNDHLIEQILHTIGEPPVVETQDDPAFANYMRRAVLSIATSQVRRHMAGQLRRFLPEYVAAGKWKEAVAIDYNAFRTALGNEVSPFLVQMTLGGLTRWYEQHEGERDSEPSNNVHS